jgi:hypothetical protein
MRGVFGASLGIIMLTYEQQAERLVYVDFRYDKSLLQPAPAFVRRLGLFGLACNGKYSIPSKALFVGQEVGSKCWVSERYFLSYAGWLLDVTFGPNF